MTSHSTTLLQFILKCMHNSEVTSKTTSVPDDIFKDTSTMNGLTVYHGDVDSKSPHSSVAVQ